MLGAPTPVKDVAVQAVLARDDPWAPALLVIDQSCRSQLITADELEAMGGTEALRVVAQGWAVPLPPENLDSTAPGW